MAVLFFLFRLRIAILALGALATAAAIWFVFHGHAVPVGALFLCGASLIVGGLIAFAHLRHAASAALVVLAPLPGMIAAGAFAPGGGLAVTDLLACYGFAVVFGSCLCGDAMRRVLDAATPADAARETLARALGALLLAVVIGVALTVAWLFRDARALGLGGASGFAAAALSVLAIVPFAFAMLPFGEPFFVAANRARERRETWLRNATLVTDPRWALSLSGSAIVLATLGWFGAEPLLRHSALLAQPGLWGASALIVFLSAFGLARDWRDAVAATLALAALVLLALYLWGRASGHLGATSFVEIVVAAALALFLMLGSIAQTRRYRRSGDTMAVARLRAIEDAGLAPWFGALGAAGAAAPWVLVHGSTATLALLFPLSVAAALLGQPALATALESLIPRRRSLGELYGRG